MSIAMYYYTPSRQKKVRLGKSSMTNYVERAGERFANDRLRRIRHKLQIKIKRVLHVFVRRS